MDEFSVLIGGKAGFGIDKSSLIIASIFNRLGYRLYIYRDYPSLIRGGHTFSIIRSSKQKIASHTNKIDFLLALTQDTVDLHRDKLKDNAILIYDSDSIKQDTLPESGQAIGLALSKIIKEENAPEIMRNVCVIGALCKVAGIAWSSLEVVFKKNFPKIGDMNLKVARRGYDGVKELLNIESLNQKKLPLFTGNEATALGLIKGGLKAYIAYPMTPSSPILHTMANLAENFSLKVIHPENEIAVMLMALGFSYCGQKVAVGTSGGGFCLMTEGLSFSAMAELPVVAIVGQRPGPSTGLPTYSSQTEMHFALNAGHGEFTRFVVAPGDAEEAYYWSQVALNISWKYQIPSIILSDKTLGEGTYSFDESLIREIKEEAPLMWDGKGIYKRYMNTDTGVSPLAFVPNKDAIIKVNSYEHDELGITTEDPGQTQRMQDKRLRKEKRLTEELASYEAVKVYTNDRSSVGMLCWGSNKGVCVELGKKLHLKVIQPVVLSPFPIKQLTDALQSVKLLVVVESNATGQLVRLISRYGIRVQKKILKYDGRPFSLDELEEKLKEFVG